MEQEKYYFYESSIIGADDWFRTIGTFDSPEHARRGAPRHVSGYEFRLVECTVVQCVVG